MNKLGELICKNKWLIVITSILLLIPATIGYFKTKTHLHPISHLMSDILCYF